MAIVWIRVRLVAILSIRGLWDFSSPFGPRQAGTSGPEFCEAVESAGDYRTIIGSCRVPRQMAPFRGTLPFLLWSYQSNDSIDLSRLDVSRVSDDPSWLGKGPTEHNLWLASRAWTIEGVMPLIRRSVHNNNNKKKNSRPTISRLETCLGIGLL